MRNILPIIRQPLYIVFIFLLAGCSIGNKHGYHNISSNLNISGTKTIDLAVLDQRPYILSGDKSPNFSGLIRGGYGNPFDVTTESKAPLAKDMTQSLSASFRSKGFSVTEIQTSHLQSPSEVKFGNGSRKILLILRELKSDTMVDSWLYYNLELKIMDQASILIAEKKLQNKKDLNGSFWNPPARAKLVIPDAVRQTIEELFNDPAIVKALGD